MTSEISLQSLSNQFEKEGNSFACRAPLDRAHTLDPNFDVDKKLKEIPKQYLENLVSLNLAEKQLDRYIIDEPSISKLQRKFAPTLVFDSKEKQIAQLGNLTPYLIALFSKQYELLKNNFPEDYKSFADHWKENPTEEQFLQFLELLTESGETKIPKNFFQDLLKLIKLQLTTPPQRQVYVNFIPGKEDAVIQYYTFFPVNNQNRIFSTIAKICFVGGKIIPCLKKYTTLSFHLGDWERVDVYIKKRGDDFVPVGITYPGHGKANIHKMTLPRNSEVFVMQGGHAMRPSRCFLDLMLDNCNGNGERVNLKDESIRFVPIALHNLLLSKTLESVCLKWIFKHGPDSSPDSVPFQRSYAADPSLLEYIRLNQAWQPTQPVVGKCWQLCHPARPNPEIPVWNPQEDSLFRQSAIL